jgi:DNA-directed RNA polymerase specialized sigma24 family protein
MADGDEGHIQELADVERAREGDHDAFVRLYRQDAPPAWRLALALTSDGQRAADAVAEGFRTTLAPRRPSAPRSPLPFRLRLLSATRDAALDGQAGDPAATAHDAAARKRSQRAAEVMAAFAELPERWRTVLWLLVVEGLGTLDAARVLGIRVEEVEQLAERAQVGLRERWVRDQRAAGVEEPQAPDHLDRQLQPVLPLPRELFDAVEARWRSTRRREAGPLRLVLPGGHAVPRWAERSLVGATAALIAAGIASALAVATDPDRAPGSMLAAPAAGAGDGGASGDRMPMEPKAYLDDGPARTERPARRGGAATSSTLPAVLFDLAEAPGADAGGGIGDAEGDEPATTTTPPLLEVTVGAGSSLGASVGDRCTGLEVVGTALGCPPDTQDEGLTLDVDSALLPGT